MAKSIPISGADFWTKVDAEIRSTHGVADLFDGNLTYAALTIQAEMSVIRRTAEELFADTVAREVRNNSLRVAINGNFYDVTKSGKSDAFLGHDPIPAAETSSVGHVVIGGSHVEGRDADAFFLAFDPTAAVASWYATGGPIASAPRVTAALGGLNPLVIGGLPYGTRNLYSAAAPTGGPERGPPGPDHEKFLIQRSNNGYVAAASRGDDTGKVAVAIASAKRRMLVIVQEHGTTGISIDALRDKLIAVGIDHAVLLDGSDSAMLTLEGAPRIVQAENKDETCTIGLGFRYATKAYLFRGGEYMRYDILEDRADRGPMPIKGNWRKMPAAFQQSIDAALRWDDHFVYFFKGPDYVRWNIWEDEVDTGPKPIKGNWRGVPDHFASGIDSAVEWGDGNYYMTKGSEYIRFNKALDKVDRGPVPIKGNWVGIPTAFESGFDSMVRWPDGTVYITRGADYVGYSTVDDKAVGGAKPIQGNWPRLSGAFETGFDAAVFWGELYVI